MPGGNSRLGAVFVTFFEHTVFWFLRDHMIRTDSMRENLEFFLLLALVSISLCCITQWSFSYLHRN